MTITSKWFWPGIAAAAALLAAGSTLLIRGRDQTITDMPEEPVSSYEIHAEDVQLQISVEQNAAPAAIPEAEVLPEQGYLLKLREDTLYVYAEGEREPIAEYDLPAGWLPDYDRILLEYGFRAANQEELRQLIEDYVS